VRRAAPVAGLLALAAGAWVLTGQRMDGMDGGPGTDLGTLGWFAVSWLLMMAAMMLPSLGPAALTQASDGKRTVAPFVAGYLAAWTAAGVAAYLLLDAVRGLDPAFLAWDRAGRYIAAGVILAAAAYQLSSTKAGCLDRCRAPGRSASGGLRGGLRHGAWCVGCCAGLMAVLFAVGVMNVAWMAAVAVMIGAERLLPWRTPLVYALAGTLLALAVWMAVAPGDLPGFTMPGAMA
jgi:predicted metal-binding membrane protein